MVNPNYDVTLVFKVLAAYRFPLYQRVLYLLPLCLNHDFRGFSVGAAEAFLCQPPLSVQKLCIPPSVQPCWSSRFLPFEKKKKKCVLSIAFSPVRFGKRFPFPASFSCEDAGSQVNTKTPGQRWICTSVKIIITAKLTLLHIWSDSRLCCTSSQFSGNGETLRVISGSSQLSLWH